MKKSILNLGIALALFAAGACAALAVVYTVTKDTIDGHAQRQLLESQQELFPQASEFVAVNSGFASADPLVQFDGAWKAMQGSTVVGLVVKGRAGSYSGEAELLIGIGTDQKVAGTRILLLKDTPGLGANAAKASFFVDKSTQTTFPGQFTGKSVGDAFAVGSDVIGITASTITSKALAGIVKAASVAGGAWLASNATGGK